MKIKKLDYGLSISYEEMEMVILGSSGQSGHTSLVIIQVAVDGGYCGASNIVFNSEYDQRLLIEEAPEKIREALTNFRKEHFVKQAKALNDSDISEIVKTWKEMLEI